MDSVDFTYNLKKSSKAKNISIRISQEGVVNVTIPKHIPVHKAVEFINEKKDWINKKLRNIKKQPKYKFEDGSKIPYLGEEITISVQNKKIKHPKAEINGSQITVYMNMYSTPTEKAVKETITKTMKRYFREIIYEAVEEWNRLYQLKYNRIAIKDNKTNWGSCSSKRNLNFTWKLIFAPLDIIDYVVVHELCHLKEHNHSKHFWSLVEKQIPDYKKKRKWLRDNAYKLTI